MIQQLHHTQIAINAISKKLDDSVPEIRAKAAEALGKIGDMNVVGILVGHLQSENDINVKLNIIYALGEIGHESAIIDLVSFLNDSNPDIRNATVKALGKIGNEQAVSCLIQSLRDTNATVRATTAKALGEIGLEDAISSLADACSDDDDTVRLNAVEALGKIGSRYALI